MTEISHSQSALEDDDPSAAEELLPLVYEELRTLAARQLARESPGQTLQATALVHEAYLRLVGPDDRVVWDNRGHFFAAAAESMRRILVDNARQKHSQKRGGGRHRVEIADLVLEVNEDADDVLALDEALTRLAGTDAQAAELVMLRYFAGLTNREAAKVLGVSPRSADFLWAYARAYLWRSLSESHQNG